MTIEHLQPDLGSGPTRPIAPQPRGFVPDAPMPGTTGFAPPLSMPPADATMLVFNHPRVLAAVRRLVRTHAQGAGLGAERAQDLTVAVNELVANSLEHGGGCGRLLIWMEHDAVVCQVEDPGRSPDMSIDRNPRTQGDDGGRGLLLVHELCDQVRVYRRAAGTTVRVRVNR